MQLFENSSNMTHLSLAINLAYFDQGEELCKNNDVVFCLKMFGIAPNHNDPVKNGHGVADNTSQTLDIWAHLVTKTTLR